MVAAADGGSDYMPRMLAAYAADSHAVLLIVARNEASDDVDGISEWATEVPGHVSQFDSTCMQQATGQQRLRLLLTCCSWCGPAGGHGVPVWATRACVLTWRWIRQAADGAQIGV
jgi:hypothetical protein